MLLFLFVNIFVLYCLFCSHKPYFTTTLFPFDSSLFDSSLLTLPFPPPVPDA